VDYFRTFVGPERVFLVPHGVDTNFFQPAHTPEQGGMRCLFVGQWLRDFAALKGTIDTMAQTDPDVRFTVVTTDEYAPGFAGLANVAVATRVSDADLLSAYQHADALVLPLTDATANNALLKDWRGLPIVTTDVGGVRDTSHPSADSSFRRGTFSDMPGDPHVEIDSTLKATMGRHSRSRALRFDWHLVGDQLLGILDNSRPGHSQARPKSRDARTAVAQCGGTCQPASMSASSFPR
jgi:glycosyltransferase involved in cell wall biosynthesis